MNLSAVAGAINQTFLGKVQCVANDRGSLTIKVGTITVDIDPDGGISNLVDMETPGQ